MALIRMRLQKSLPLLQHQHVQKPAVVLFHLLFQISKEKLLCSLQSFPTLLSLYHEGFACSHLGVSSIWFSCFHVNRDTPSLLLHTTPYTTVLSAAFRVKSNRLCEFQRGSQLFIGEPNVTRSIAMRSQSLRNQ